MKSTTFNFDTKKDKETRKCYKCDKVGHLAKDYRLGQKIKIRRNQEDSDEEDNDKKEGFVKGLECYGTLWTLTFSFFFYLFSLILYFFSFEFYFPFS